MDGSADYVFLRELGRGAHSQVYLARTPRSPRSRRGHGRGQGAVPARERAASTPWPSELSLVAALRSPQLVPMYDVGMDAGVVFYAMRHEPIGVAGRTGARPDAPGAPWAVAPGGPRRARDARGRPSHRGIGPTNILLDTEGAVLAEPAVGHLLTHGHTLSGLGAGARVGWSSSTRSS